MKTVKVSFSDGDCVITRINGTEAEIREYYQIGRLDVVAYEDGNGWHEYVRKITNVEFI